MSEMKTFNKIGEAIKELYANKLLKTKYIICDRPTYDKVCMELSQLPGSNWMVEEAYGVPLVIASNGFKGFEVVPSAMDTRKYISEE